ncbi:hypothetical protein SLEP1_g4985 [Rubroshorea leprosula]|uniref:PGG domain-containing protein n=1 Tax=Rubroshorea leprosula TaxID=152421 RepID=A0AAV5HUT0_9ROSI|nr:hypothetical protein SLEP1_g4985 [Rubroshorea leprosula]
MKGRNCRFHWGHFTRSLRGWVSVDALFWYNERSSLHSISTRLEREREKKKGVWVLQEETRLGSPAEPRPGFFSENPSGFFDGFSKNPNLGSLENPGFFSEHPSGFSDGLSREPRPRFSEKNPGFQTMERAQSLIVQNAIDKGDVNAVMDLFKRNPGAENLGFWTGRTSLHYATMVGKSNIVKVLLESMPAVQKDLWDDTALSWAAGFGNTEISKYLVSKDSTLLSMKNTYQEIPVVTACRRGHKEVTNFLYSETPFEILLCENGEQGSRLLHWCFSSKRFDIMFDVLHRGQSLIDEYWKDLLDGFATTPTAFITGSGLTFWQRWIYECRLWRLASILLPFPDLLLAPLPMDDETLRGNFLMDAIAFRQEKIARFLVGLPLGKAFIYLLDSHKNTILHKAGILASDSQLSCISGAALQMQREIQWFKEVESLVSQHGKNEKNKNGETPYQVLAREHKALLKEAEDWMKGLANSYIIVGALIITIMFTGAFTLPGGNDETWKISTNLFPRS